MKRDVHLTAVILEVQPVQGRCCARHQRHGATTRFGSDGTEFTVVAGSQAALAQFPEGLPKFATLFAEADLVALDDPDDAKAMQINAAIGEDTLFHEIYGYYAEGIGRALLVLPPTGRSEPTECCRVGKGM